jgi:multiple sugar transport system ATP-binding protein
MADVVLKTLTKSFENAPLPVVNDVSFEVRDQEFMVLVGPSGCGKSTTLRMIAGLEDPTSGDIYIGGNNVTQVPPKDRDIAMVFQNYALYPHLNVYENLAFSLKLRKHNKEDIRQRVEKAAEILGIHFLLNRRPKELSGGQRQRVALGRAIVREPKVFLFDEPLSNLDAKLRVQMRTEILKLHHQLNSTMIYVTHDQMEAMTMGDRIVILKDGIVQQIDEPLQLYNDPVNKFVAGFIGSPSMNFIELSLRDAKLGFAGITLPPNVLPGNTDVSRIKHLGIRPEKLKFADNGNLDITFEAVVEVSEKMGHETLHYLKLDQYSFILREMGKRAGIVPGSVTKTGFNLEDCHLFDQEDRTIPKQ